MSAKEPNDIERMEGLLSSWQERAQEVHEPSVAPSDELPLPPFCPGWAAGLLDGEGCIHIARQRGRRGGPASYHLRVSLSQNDLEVLEHFQRGLDLGGRIYEVPRRPGHSRQVHVLNFSTAQSIALLQRLGRRLVRKRGELALARRFWVECMPGVRPGPKGMPAEVRALREWLYHEMKRIKRAPVAAPGKKAPVGGGSR